MQKRYQIVDLSIGGNTIDVTATVEDDGGLTIYDLSYGTAADQCFGEGRDVEVWLEIPPDGVRQLSEKLLGRVVEHPGDDLAGHLASKYADDSQMLSKIQALLDDNEIRYEKSFWH